MHLVTDFFLLKMYRDYINECVCNFDEKNPEIPKSFSAWKDSSKSEVSEITLSVFVTNSERHDFTVTVPNVVVTESGGILDLSGLKELVRANIDKLIDRSVIIKIDVNGKVLLTGSEL